MNASAIRNLMTQKISLTPIRSLTQGNRIFFPPILKILPVLPPVPKITPGSGGPVFADTNTRPLWFDGRFLGASDLAREQDYFLKRQAVLGRAGGFGVLHGLLVDQGASITQPAGPETIVIHAGDGITPAGELVMIPTDLTIQLSDLPEEENLDVQFGLSTSPQQPARTRTGLYVLALRPVQFTANPITSYPADLQSPRTSSDGNIIEATAVSLVPYTNPVNNFDASLQQAALARQIFVEGDTGTLSDSLLPLAMISLDRDVIQWIDPYLVRRDSGPQYSGVRPGLADPATQQAFLLQYDAQLQSVVAGYKTTHPKADFAASDYFQALPPAGRFPLDALNTGNFTQAFFPQQMNLELSIVPADELPAILEDSMSMPPIDLTLAASSYANMSVYALVPVPRNDFATLLSSLPPTPLKPALQQIVINRRPLLPLQIFRSPLTLAPTASGSSAAWATLIGTQVYGFYLLRRSEPVFVDFTTPPAPPVTTTTPGPTTTPGLAPHARPAIATPSIATRGSRSTPATTTTPPPAAPSTKSATRKRTPRTTTTQPGRTPRK